MIFNPATGSSGSGSGKIAVYSMILDAGVEKIFDFGFTPILGLAMVDDSSPSIVKPGSVERIGDVRFYLGVTTGTDCMIRNSGDVSRHICFVVFGENNG